MAKDDVFCRTCEYHSSGGDDVRELINHVIRGVADHHGKWRLSQVMESHKDVVESEVRSFLSKHELMIADYDEDFEAMLAREGAW